MTKTGIFRDRRQAIESRYNSLRRHEAVKVSNNITKSFNAVISKIEKLAGDIPVSQPELDLPSANEGPCTMLGAPPPQHGMAFHFSSPPPTVIFFAPNPSLLTHSRYPSPLAAESTSLSAPVAVTPDFHPVYLPRPLPPNYCTSSAPNPGRQEPLHNRAYQPQHQDPLDKPRLLP